MLSHVEQQYLNAYSFEISAVKSHYENMPIQIYWKFYHQKMKHFS